jgi:hypothetical protein
MRSDIPDNFFQVNELGSFLKYAYIYISGSRDLWSSSCQGMLQYDLQYDLQCNFNLPLIKRKGGQGVPELTQSNHRCWGSPYSIGAKI